MKRLPNASEARRSSMTRRSVVGESGRTFGSAALAIHETDGLSTALCFASVVVRLPKGANRNDVLSFEAAVQGPEASLARFSATLNETQIGRRQVRIEVPVHPDISCGDLELIDLQLNGIHISNVQSATLFDDMEDDVIINMMQEHLPLLSDQASLSRVCHRLHATIQAHCLCQRRVQTQGALEERFGPVEELASLVHADLVEGSNLPSSEAGLLAQWCLPGGVLQHTATLQLGDRGFILPVAELMDRPLPIGVVPSRMVVRDRANAVTRLLLSSSGISDAEVVMIAVFANCGALPQLTRLELEHNPALTDVGILSVAGALQAGALPCLCRLLISGNKVSDAAIQVLSNALQRDRRVLRPSDDHSRRVHRAKGSAKESDQPDAPPQAHDRHVIRSSHPTSLPRIGSRISPLPRGRQRRGQRQ